jgi:hypothetical protein
VWALGTYDLSGRKKTLTLHWDGTAWEVVPGVDPSGTYEILWMEGISALSENDVWAAGYYLRNNGQNHAFFAHWNGSAWVAVPGANVTHHSVLVRSIAATSPTDIWAVGGSVASIGAQLQTLVERYRPVCGTPLPASPTPQGTSTATPSRTPVGGTATPTQTGCQPGVFSDVPPDHTFYPYITCLVNRGIISGYADCTFRPGNNVTRGQLSKIVSNAAGFSDIPGGQTFQDVPPAHSFYLFIERMSVRGIIGGYACGSVPEEPCVPPSNRPYFRPGSNATRGQISKIVSNAAGFSEIPVGQMFEDVPPTHTFYLWVCGCKGSPCVGS